MNIRISHSLAIFVLLFFTLSAIAQTGSGERYQRVVIRNAIVIDGNGTPASGPKDIVIENDRIAEIVNIDPVAVKEGRARRPAKGDFEIDAEGKYVMPGLINLHGHTHDGRGGKSMPVEYCQKLWLAHGITTIRDVGSYSKTLEWRDKSANNEIASPRIVAYGVFNNGESTKNVEAARERVRQLKREGYEGMKLFGVDRDIMAALMDEAKKQGLRVAHHTGVEETNTWDDIRFGTSSIEHWYGIPEAAIPNGRQNYPADYNYNDEVDRFRYAGRLWREADWDRLMKVFDAMIEADVAWNPTLNIYEASRDLQRAQNQPHYAEYLHPVLAEFFIPNPANHGSYFIGWTSTDEVFWKENYRIWMKALREFEKRGGTIGAGEDAGFIYQVYGFGLIRELELHQEAGFHPLMVIKHATGNNAKIMGKEDELGRIRVGFKADILVVNGNPLEDLKVLYATGTEEIVDGEARKTGGVEWTVKDGIPFHAPTMAAEVRKIVADAKAQ
ncbi:MAG: amidohydrolase [Acidobacteria bacterium]|nr:MAG: amidohydrolase [Acidobacteriota bacterium]REK01506.1 MAG: amidohydrolase [Acidobacteriota bacterium]REK14462.1 MAG: amidohydrolase [Acidobacteriota bacterium]REK45177.1 MAG: amidohydrolase [Acidobacteriota bacterium]